MITYIREHIWSHLPAHASLKLRLWAALAWGIAFPLAFGLLRWLLHRDEPYPLSLTAKLVAVGVVFGLALLIPTLGEGLYLWVLRIFSIVGFVVSSVALTLVFYLVVTPMGWGLRVTGKISDGREFKTGSSPSWKTYEGHKDPRRYYRLS